MSDGPRLRSGHHVPATTSRAITPEGERLLARLPADIITRLNRILDEHQAHKAKGPGRVIEVHLHLDDSTGQVTKHGTFVVPPREWATEESAERRGLDGAAEMGVG